IPALKICYRSIYKFTKVVRKNLGCKSHCNTFHSLCKQEREFNRKGNGFFVTSIVRRFPFSDFGIENNLVGKLCKASLDVTRSSSPVACIYVPPVTLSVYKKVFLTQLNQGITN